MKKVLARERQLWHRAMQTQPGWARSARGEQLTPDLTIAGVSFAQAIATAYLVSNSTRY